MKAPERDWGDVAVSLVAFTIRFFAAWWVLGVLMPLVGWRAPRLAEVFAGYVVLAEAVRMVAAPKSGGQ